MPNYPTVWASEFPDKPAVIDSLTGTGVTYRELDDRSKQLAQLWWARGLRRGDRVAVFLENNLRYLELIWAALRSGLYLAPINRYLTTEEVAYILEDCAASAVVTSKHLEAVAGALPEPTWGRCVRLAVDGPVAGFERYEQAIAEHPTRPLDHEPMGSFLLYSSGTTGRPKGILRPLLETTLEEASELMGVMQRELWGWGTDTVYLSPAPFYHSAPLIFCTLCTALGGTAVVMPRFDAIESLHAIEKYGVNQSQWVPTMFTRLLRLSDQERGRCDLSSHRCAIHAAAPCPVEIKRRMIEWWGPILYEYYGGSESNGCTHITPQQWLEHPGSVGRPYLGIVHICDEQGNEMPTGTPGLVYFELEVMPFKYLNDDQKTRDVQHPAHQNWSTLGDVGYVDEEGFLYLTDRATFMIVSGGVNIYPQEIEDTIITHPKVLDVAVVGVPDAEMGEAVKAVVQLVPGFAPSDDLGRDIQTWTRDRLARYKCPKSVDFVAELPRLPTGKLYKRLVKDRYWGDKTSRIV
jgi:fatty-acyl-CoA synthase